MARTSLKHREDTMNYITVDKWQRDESIALLVKATFPNYKRKQVSINASGRVTFQDLNWSGGTRSEYIGATLRGNQTGNLSRFNAMAPWDIRQIEGQSIDIPQGHCVIRSGYFCGKTSILTIYVNPADMPKLLPQSTEVH
jgi:hypothetical protein